MIKIKIDIPDELYESAKATAQLQNTTISGLIRQELEIIIKKLDNNNE